MIYKLSDGTVLEYAVVEDNCKICNSFLIVKKYLKLEFINFLRETHSLFRLRSAKSYYREWKAHNLLYKLHILRCSTRDTDLCIYEYMWRRIGYFIISLFPIDI